MFNRKVKIWAVELETFNIEFEHISGIKNTLADTLSRIIRVDPDFKAEPESEGYELGYSCFEELPPAKVCKVITETVMIQSSLEIAIPETECHLPVPKERLCRLQMRDARCQVKVKQVKTNTDTSRSYYIDAKGF